MSRDKTMNESLKLLLDTAEEMILEKGCRATTLQDIADRAGLTKGAIYHYVKSKDELFGMILEAGLEKTNQRFYESVEKSPGGDEGLQGPMNALSQRIGRVGAADNANTLIFMYLLSNKDKPAVADILKRHYEASIESSTKWIEAGQQHGGIPATIDAKKASRMLALFKNGLQIQRIIGADDHIDEAEVYKFLMSALTHDDGKTDEA
ncbi:TetR/AcrR family transcriptional regulator [Paenibacillus sp. FSL W8-0194]|uniref:TetR/AcrR family transcriptional regulator n=1 Tax=Paenibacillus sp. FSL W8-0194 TaxID=2921711 RepID=UPI0030D739AA